MEHPNDHKNVFREWLEKLQQESWQLELLISGFAIVGIYAARTTIKNLEIYTDLYLFDEAHQLASTFVFVLQKGWWIFFINLIFHVILRGLWIGAIGLRYVSGEINYEQFNYAERVSRFLKTKVGSYDDFIENLERLCSVIFAYTFLLFLLFFSMMVFFMQTGLIGVLGTKIFGQDTDTMQALSLVLGLYMILGFIVFLDLITLGGFKRVKEKHIASVYYYIYRFYSTVTLSFLYRPLLYNFIDNPYTKKLFFLSIPYIGLILIGPAVINNNPLPYLPEKNELYNHGMIIDDYYYDDLRNTLLQEFPNEERRINKKNIPPISLEQFRVNQNTSSLFIQLTDEFNELLEHMAGKKSLHKKGIHLSGLSIREERYPEIDTLEKTKSKQRKPLLSRRLEITKEIKKQPDNKALVQRKDSLSRELEKLDQFWDDSIGVVKKRLTETSIDDFLAFVGAEIDDQPILLSHKNCRYYQHPHLGEMGLKCFFRVDTLQTGMHEMKYTYKEYRKSKETKENTLLLPFIKE